MGLNLGNTNIGEIYLGNTKIAEAYLGSSKIYSSGPPVDPYNPLGLPANTIRCKFNSSSYTPTIGDSQTLVETGDNYSVWDIYIASNSWNSLFERSTRLTEVLGANTTNVTNMSGMFYSAYTLTTLALFDTSNVTNMESFCNNAGSLTYIPLFNTSNVTTVYNAFNYCRYVTGGALALYNQMSTQANPPSNHYRTFYNCGSSTTTGAAELAQIPSGWKDP